ncbi:MAG: DUF4352 domain-containing protein [Ruminococcaceae bacterium]|nr:DUF4352 domain-containing protein [Oscillospiraceae bacterium]
MENEKKKSNKKKWIIIAIVIVLFIAIASAGSSEPTVETPTDEAGVSESVNETNDSKEAETTAAATDKIEVGSTVTNSEVKIIYKSCNTDFKKYSQYADIKSGHKIVQAVFDFENISETDISLNGFDCYADGVKCESFYYVDDYSDPVLTSISAGRKLTDATVYYEVPTDAELIELEYEADFWSGDKYIFIIK